MFGVDAFATDYELGLRGDGAGAGTRSTKHVCGIASASNGQYMLTAGTDCEIRYAFPIRGLGTSKGSFLQWHDKIGTACANERYISTVPYTIQ